MASYAPKVIATSPLCATCTAVFTSKPQLLPPVDEELEDGFKQFLLLESTTHSFNAGAASGCRLCTLLLSGESSAAEYTAPENRDKSLAEEGKYKITFSLVIEEDAYPHLRMVFIGTLEGAYHHEEWHLQLIPDVEKYQLELDAWTGSKSSLDIAKGWMEKCDADHQDCHSYKQQVKSDKSPSRLLSLGSMSSPHLKLCDENLGHVEYATLSHCWGINMPLKLVTSNIDAMKKVIDPEDLSPTFCDAVAVCRHLGLRYLWIDSLCIVQDSAQDWQYESSRMHSVYSNAILNVCGTAANPHGLFLERKNEHVHTGSIQVDWEGVCQGVYFCMLEKVWFDEVYHSPLNERGWVLQERLLSQRNLLFGENQLFWECQQQTACELTPDGFEGEMCPEPYTQKVLSLKHGKAMVYDHAKDEDNTLSQYAIWDMIVDKYSNSDLTLGADRLIAVSALARHCQTHLGLEGEYLAGIWSRYIPYQLLWETHADLHGQRQRGYQAPTWSWASMDDLVFDPCGIEYADERDVVIQVQDWKIDLVSADQYGQVSGGHITISCRLAKVVVCADTTEWDHPKYDLKVDLDCFVPTKGKFQKDTLFEGSSDTLVVDLYQNLVVMPVRKDLFLEEKYPCWHGLVLRPVGGKDRTFERLGRYTMKDDEALFEQAFADFDLRAEESGLEFESNGEKGNMYTVRIE